MLCISLIFSVGTPSYAADGNNTTPSVINAIESDIAYADPFNDIDVELHLWGNGRLYKIPAFWDGGSRWKIRFACPSAGVWYFRTVCTDAENTALDGRTGKVICSEEYEFTATKFGTYYLGDRPQATDMVLHISAADEFGK